MKKFTELYKKTREVLQAGNFSTDGWQKALDEAGVKGLFSESGFDETHQAAPDKIRTKVKTATDNWFSRWFLGGDNRGEVIYKASENAAAAASHNDRAASLKVITHLYRQSKKGGQDVWIYSPPKDYAGWVFDELTGDARSVKQKLNKSKEIFSDREKQHMSDALLMALKVAEKTKADLSTKSENLQKLVKRWFMDDTCGDDELNEAIRKLTAGFNKIAASCGSNTLVFTDYPDWRGQRARYMGAAFRGGEGGGFPVVYIEGAFTSYAGNSGMLWTCARTIIHELSHLEVNTKDIQYRHTGLKPKASFPYRETIKNADSWACFAIDLAGYLSATDRKAFLV